MPIYKVLKPSQALKLLFWQGAYIHVEENGRINRVSAEKTATGEVTTMVAATLAEKFYPNLLQEIEKDITNGSLEEVTNQEAEKDLLRVIMSAPYKQKLDEGKCYIKLAEH